MNKLLVGLALWAVSGMAAAGVKIEHWTAPSGAQVYFVESHVLPIVDLEVDMVAGSAYDPVDESGLAQLTRGLLDAGAGDMDEERIAGRLVDIGAQLGGATDPDRSAVTLRTLSAAHEREAAIELLRTVLQQPTFPAAVLEREKLRSIAAIQEAETRPADIASRRFFAALYPGHPYGLNPTAESVARISRDDVVAFYRGHYGARRAVVSIIGDLSRAEAETMAAHLTDALPPAPPPAGLPEVKLPQSEVVRVAHPAAQAHIFLGLPAIRRGAPDFFPLLVGNFVLGGGGFVSRLTKEVREKRGYAYSVYSYFRPMKQLGPFQVGLQTKREQAEAALALVNKTIDQFLKTGPTEEELAVAKRNLADGFALRLDSNRKLLEYVSVIGFYGLPLTYLDDFPGKVRAVTAAEIRAAFHRHVLPQHMVTVVVAGG